MMTRSRAGPLLIAALTMAAIILSTNSTAASAAPATGIGVQTHTDAFDPPTAHTPDAFLSAAEFGHEDVSSGDNVDFRIASGSPTQSAGPPAESAESSISDYMDGMNTGTNGSVEYMTSLPPSREIHQRPLDPITELLRSLHAAEVRATGDRTAARSNLNVRTARDALSTLA